METLNGREDASPLEGGSRRVLVVDDDVNMCELIAASLAIGEVLQHLSRNASLNLPAFLTAMFGGILITNKKVDLATAQAIDDIFYEVLLAPEVEPEAYELLRKKKNRILLKIKDGKPQARMFRSLLKGVISQDMDHKTETASSSENSASRPSAASMSMRLL